MTKQNVLSRNLSIMCIPATDGEDLIAISLKIFSLLGCGLSESNLFGCYPIKKGNLFSNIFIVKINEFAVKQQIMKAKINKDLRLKDIIAISSNDNPSIYVNNHVTPFFGKLLAEGRKAIKESGIHSVWLNRNGCQVRLVADGAERIYRSVNELQDLIASHRDRLTNHSEKKANKRSRPDDSEISPNSVHKSKKMFFQRSFSKKFFQSSENKLISASE